MKSRLLGTTALLGAALAVASFPNIAAAQQACPQSSLTGTGNVSNALCNYASTPVPFVLTAHVDAQETAQAIGGNHIAESGAANTGDHDFGFEEAAWARLDFRGYGDGGWKYGFRGNLVMMASAQPGFVDGSHSSFDREYFFVLNPKWGQIQFGEGPSSATATFPYTFGPGGSGWGPPGPAIDDIGPDGGSESQALVNDATAGAIDGALSPLGGDSYHSHTNMGIRYVSPNYFGSDPDHGVQFDIRYSPDGHGHSGGNYYTQSNGVGSQAASGNGVNNTLNLIESAISYDEVFLKNYEFSTSVGVEYGQEKGGGPGPATFGAYPVPGTAGFIGTVGNNDATGPASSDLFAINSGASVTWKDSLIVGVDFTYAGNSFYAPNTPAWNATGTKAYAHNPAWGTSLGVQYDWDRYQTGIYYQYAVSQGDMSDNGYVQLQYLGFGGSAMVLKGLKIWTEVLFFNDRDNHSPATITGGAFCGSIQCRRSADGEIFLLGTSLDF
jgi:hypothetical protein